jgi:hypothetical protein
MPAPDSVLNRDLIPGGGRAINSIARRHRMVVFSISIGSLRRRAAIPRSFVVLGIHVFHRSDLFLHFHQPTK